MSYSEKRKAAAKEALGSYDFMLREFIYHEGVEHPMVDIFKDNRKTIISALLGEGYLKGKDVKDFGV